MNFLNILNPFNKKFEGYASHQMQIAPGLTNGEYIKLYGEIGWVYACASRIADAVGQTDFDIVDLKGDIVSDSMIGKLLEKPNEFTNKYEFFQMTDMYLSLTGSCYWYIAKEGTLGLPQELWIINPEHMYIVPDKNNFIKGYVYRCGEEIPLDVDEVIYLQLAKNPSNPYLSVSPLHALGNVADTERQAVKYNRNFFYNSAIPQGILKSEKTLSDTAFERLKRQWNSKHQGVKNSHKTAILEGGISYQQISVNNKDSDFINMRASNRDEILSVFGCPKGIMGLGSGLSYAAMVVEEQVFEKYTVSPRVRLIRDKINNELLPLFIHEKDRYKVKTRQNITQDKEFIKGVLDSQTNKSITVNEARGILSNILDVDLAPLPDGDTLPKNFTTYDLDFEEEETGEKEKTYKKKDLIKKINKQMNASKGKYAEEVSKATIKIEMRFKKDLEIYFRDMCKEIAENTDLETGNIDFNQDKWDKRLKELAEPYYKETYLKAYDMDTKLFDKYTNGIYSKVIGEINEKGYLERVFALIIHRLTLLVGVNTRTYKKVQEVIKPLIIQSSENFTIKEVSKRLQETGLFSPERCQTIAQTEIMSSFNESAYTKYETINAVDRKAWINNGDELVRESHIEAGAKYSESNAIPKDEKFIINGYEALYPCDNSLPAEEVINCRCCIMGVLREDI